jgi:sulfate/thiosulfate transport system ATP-binding protein
MSIAVRNLNKTFGAFKALDDVTLTIPEGKLVALLGPSGSGKTTLLRIIAGLETPDPTEGSRVQFFGHDVTDAHVRQRGVGFVFQHYALFKHMSVFENIAFGLRVKKRTERPSNAEINARVMELLKLVQLDGLHKRFPNQLSGGQRQRVALARALAVKPKVLLLDEPFGALDARVRAELRAWLRRLHDELHVTSVFVTHDQEEAMEVADQVVVMDKGTIQQVGSPEEVFHHPANEFVLRFLGQVNLFHGRVENGQAVFGPAMTVSTGAAEGSNARLLVRPHELTVDVVPGAGAIAATIRSLHAAGPTARVEAADASGQPVVVLVPHDRARSLALAPGKTIYLTPNVQRVLVEDFSI